MARCKSCSAPLRPNNLNCAYCGVRNDMDLHGRVSFRLVRPESARICPNCDHPLQTIDLNINGRFYIERCTACFGLFFDPGEIEEVLEHSVSHADHINQALLGQVTEDRYQPERQIRYLKCPECQAFMARRNFGHRSGVVIDRCNVHGVWLDSGELIHLLEWKKAGGQVLHEQRAHENPKRSRRGDSPRASDGLTGMAAPLRQNSGPPDLEDLIGDALSSLVKGLFR